MTSTPESAVPYPPPFWWTKRLALLAAAMACAVVGTRLWWGHVASGRVQAMIDAAHANGEPILPADFNAPPIADADNAAFYLKRAAAAVNKAVESPAMSAYEFPEFLPYRPQWHAMADAAFAVNAAVYPDARRARAAKGVDWGVRLTTPLILILLPELNEQRNLANLLGDTALRAHFRGDDAEAMELIADLRALSRATDHQPFLVSHLVAIGIDAISLHRLQAMIGNLTIADTGAPSTRPAARPATRIQVRAMIDDLLDDALYAIARRRAMLSERMSVFDNVQWFPPTSVALRPMYELDAVRAVEHVNAFAPAMAAPNWPAMQATMPPTPSPNASPTEALSRFASSIVRTPYNRVFSHEHRTLFDRRAVAVALALRLYRLDHGRFPLRLDELVPAYLPAIPVDPFSAGGEPLKYIVARNGARPVVYSVSENGRDDTPTEAALPAGAAWGWQNVRLNAAADDQHRDVSGWMPATPPPGYDPAADEALPETGADE